MDLSYCHSFNQPITHFNTQSIISCYFRRYYLRYWTRHGILGKFFNRGTGILTQILHKYSPLSLGVAMTIVDGISVLMGLMALSADDVMYSTIGLLVIGYVISVMENGFDSSKNVMIISKDYQAIREYITTVMDRGVTKIPIRGGYTTSDKVMLMAIVSTYELPALQEKILEIDDTAFIVVMPAAQVMGRGFSLTKQYKREDKDVLLPM